MRLENSAKANSDTVTVPVEMSQIEQESLCGKPTQSHILFVPCTCYPHKARFIIQISVFIHVPQQGTTYLLPKTNPKAIDNCIWVRSLSNFKMVRDNFIKPFMAGRRTKLHHLCTKALVVCLNDRQH